MNRLARLLAGFCVTALPVAVIAQPPASPGAALQHRYSFNGDAKDSISATPPSAPPKYPTTSKTARTPS